MSDHDPTRPEAEIIPPGADPVRRQDGSAQGDPFPGQGRVWVWSNDPRYGRLRAGRPGLLGLVIIFAALAAMGVIGFFVFLGAVAITLPIIAAVLIVGIVGGILRRL